jgi:predicted DNA-binding protein with PD1-like motif
MKTIESEGPYQAVTIGLGPEEKLLESIKEAIKRHDIRNGAVVSGVGTLKRCHLHITVGCREDRAWNGHLEDGSVVLYLAEVCILKMNHHGMKREMDPRYNLALLSEG